MLMIWCCYDNDAFICCCWWFILHPTSSSCCCCFLSSVIVQKETWRNEKKTLFYFLTIFHEMHSPSINNSPTQRNVLVLVYQLDIVQIKLPFDPMWDFMTHEVVTIILVPNCMTTCCRMHKASTTNNKKEKRKHKPSKLNAHDIIHQLVVQPPTTN